MVKNQRETRVKGSVSAAAMDRLRCINWPWKWNVTARRFSRLGIAVTTARFCPRDYSHILTDVPDESMHFLIVSPVAIQRGKSVRSRIIFIRYLNFTRTCILSFLPSLSFDIQQLLIFIPSICFNFAHLFFLLTTVNDFWIFILYLYFLYFL